MLIIVYSSSFSFAQAAVFDWVPNATGRASGSLAFNFISSFLNRNNQVNAKGEDNQNTDNSPAAQNVSAANIVKEIVVAATAYSSTPDQTDDTPFITALGTTVRDGIIAVNFLPFGTRVKIPDIYGDKIFVVEDRMNRRFWYRVDIWFPDRASALEFGFKKIKIQILDS